MNESFLPLVGEKQTKFEHEVDKMEVNVVKLLTLFLYFYTCLINDRMIGCYSFQRALDNLTSFHEMLIKSLFKFVQGAAHLWDLHEIGLARQERKLQVQFCWRIGTSRFENEIKLHCTLFFFFTRKASIFIYIEGIEPSLDRKMATDIR